MSGLLRDYNYDDPQDAEDCTCDQDPCKCNRERDEGDLIDEAYERLRDREFDNF